MLQSLRIRNLALLEEVELDFETGFTAVTGETGAGKSILLGALSLLAGARADKTIIRQGAPATEVEAALFFTDSRKLDTQLLALDLSGLRALQQQTARRDHRQREEEERSPFPQQPQARKIGGDALTVSRVERKAPRHTHHPQRRDKRRDVPDGDHQAVHQPAADADEQSESDSAFDPQSPTQSLHKHESESRFCQDEQ